MLFRSARALDFDMLTRIGQGYGLRPSRNAQIAMTWRSAVAMNIPVAAPSVDKATVDAPNSRTRLKAAGELAGRPAAALTSRCESQRRTARSQSAITKHSSTAQMKTHSAGKLSSISEARASRRSACDGVAQGMCSLRCHHCAQRDPGPQSAREFIVASSIFSWRSGCRSIGSSRGTILPASTAPPLTPPRALQ